MAQTDLALAVSGTVTMELAAAGTPALVLYRANWLTGLAAKRLARVDFVALPNILAGERVMPGESLLDEEVTTGASATCHGSSLV